MRGEPLKVVQELLGHANIEAMMIYAIGSAWTMCCASSKKTTPLTRGIVHGSSR
jgi:hypothetical protein